jgi:hypothetical protein
VNGDSDILFGGFGSGTIDLEDIKKLPAEGPLTSHSVFFHVIVEQWEKYKKFPLIQDFKVCHEAASAAEQMITGWKRVDELPRTINDDLSENLSYVYERDGKRAVVIIVVDKDGHVRDVNVKTM